MTRLLPNYYRAAVVPEQLRSRQCNLCRAPVDETYDFCFQCNRRLFTRPDLAGFVAYAVKNRQSGAEMRRYKDRHPSPQAFKNVLLLLEQGLSHLHCAERLLGTPVGAFAVMPSRSHYQADALSPLQRLCDRTLPENMPLVGLRPTQGAISDRQVHEDAFEVFAPPDTPHVILIDDTWVSGATVLSAVASLRKTGVQQVSVLTLARWLDPGFGPTRDFLTLGSQDPSWRRPQDVCPFTLTGSCPR